MYDLFRFKFAACFFVAAGLCMVCVPLPSFDAYLSDANRVKFYLFLLSFFFSVGFQVCDIDVICRGDCYPTFIILYDGITYPRFIAFCLKDLRMQP